MNKNKKIDEPTNIEKDDKTNYIFDKQIKPIKAFQDFLLYNCQRSGFLLK